MEIDKGVRSDMYYYVQPGDTLYSIAQQFNTTIDHLIYLNPQIGDYDSIYVGERINVRSGDDWDRYRWGRHAWGYPDYHRGHHDYYRGREEYRRGREEFRRGREDYRRGREEFARHHGH